MKIGGAEITPAWVKAKAIKHFLPMGLVSALILGLAWPWPGKEISSWKIGDFRIVQTIDVIIIFFVSGMGMKTGDITAALTAYTSLAYGLVAILGITPLFGFLMVEIPFSPTEFSTGLALFCCVPTTLTSGVTLVTQAKGNTALALILTVGSNLLGVLTTPFMLTAVLGEADISLDATKLLLKLVITIFIPLCIGKAFRENFSPVVDFTARNKVSLSILNNGCLIMVVWQTISRSQSTIVEQSAGRLFSMIIAGIMLHCVYLALNGAATQVLRLPWNERKAVWLLTSQKTLPVAITVLSYLPEEDVGEHGLIAIPCIIGHLSQLFMDAYICSKWGEMADKEIAEAASALEAEEESAVEAASKSIEIGDSKSIVDVAEIALRTSCDIASENHMKSLEAAGGNIDQQTGAKVKEIEIECITHSSDEPGSGKDAQ